MNNEYKNKKSKYAEACRNCIRCYRCKDAALNDRTVLYCKNYKPKKMNDIEKTRRWLQCCRNRTNDDLSINEDACTECPYSENGTCSPWEMFDDALSLLNELTKGGE